VKAPASLMWLEKVPLPEPAVTDRGLGRELRAPVGDGEGRRPSSDIGHMKMPASKLPLIVDANPLLGAWKLKSYVVTSANGRQSTPYGKRSTRKIEASPWVGS
jgi:hypothetical protein